jgi:hypothetical protein
MNNQIIRIVIFLGFTLALVACSPQGDSPYSNEARQILTDVRHSVDDLRGLEMSAAAVPGLRQFSCEDAERILTNRGFNDVRSLRLQNTDTDVVKLIENQTWVALGLLPADANFEAAAAVQPASPDAYFTFLVGNNGIIVFVPEDCEQTAFNTFSPQMLAVYARAYSGALQARNLDRRNLFFDARSNLDLRLAAEALAYGDQALTTQMYLESSGLDPEAFSTETYANELVTPESASFYRELITFPYIEGKAFVEAVFAEGGWDAVNAAFGLTIESNRQRFRSENRPRSTEHILHPDRFFDGDMPLEVEVVTVADLFGLEDLTVTPGNILGQVNTTAQQFDAAINPAAGLAGDTLGGETADDPAIPEATEESAAAGEDEEAQTEEELVIPEEATVEAGPEEIRQWLKLDENTVGEFMLRQQLAIALDHEQVDEAATGWGGDSYELYYHPANDERAMIWRLAFDTASDFTEFVSVYPEVLAQRTGAEPEAQEDGSMCWEGSDEVVCVLTATSELFAEGEEGPLDNQLAIALAPDLDLALQMLDRQRSGPPTEE